MVSPSVCRPRTCRWSTSPPSSGSRRRRRRSTMPSAPPRAASCAAFSMRRTRSWSRWSSTPKSTRPSWTCRQPRSSTAPWSRSSPGTTTSGAIRTASRISSGTCRSPCSLLKLTVDQLDLAGKRVFLRVDLNVPLEAGRVAEDTRIRAVLPTIEHCFKAGASVILASHLGRPKGTVDPRYSLKPAAVRLEELLGRPVPLLPDCVGPEVEAAAIALKPGETVLLENLRFHAGEEANDPEFARRLATLADVYVNDAFAAAHRAHASTEGIAHHLHPAAAGLLMARELEALGRIFESPERPVMTVLGGAKVSDKLGLVEHLLARVDVVLIGGGMAYTFLAALGHDVGHSLLESDRIEAARAILGRARALGVRVRLPVELVVARGPDSEKGISEGRVRDMPSDLMGLDIGPVTVAQFTALLA